ncbi:hypothetical protein ACQQ2N_11730 [Dokdonella sp. MW10]|uniref:hypothetical protein n=1 Tax=Dokdonella sp. MW10 TaxID=2992926 RepID=UPI003F7FEEE4
MKTLLPVLFLGLALPASVVAEELRFELYAGGDVKRVLLASGSKQYSAADFDVSREERGGRAYGTRKVLELHDGFGVGILDTYKNAGGFGLTVEHLPVGSHPNEFSWEWYDPTTGNEYVKRQGRTKIAVTLEGLPVASEVRTIRFLEDAEFRYTADTCCDDGGKGSTHVLRILAGSVLEFPR